MFKTERCEIRAHWTVVLLMAAIDCLCLRLNSPWIDCLCLKLGSQQPLSGLHINEEREYRSKIFSPSISIKKINTLPHFMNTDQGLLPAVNAGISYD